MVLPASSLIRQLFFAPMLLLITRFSDAVDAPWELDDPFLAD
jgi:hypothetical protein